MTIALPHEPNAVVEKPATVRGLVEQMHDQFARAMPRGAEATQLVRDVLTCLSRTPKLNEADPMSVVGAAMTCAQLGLRPGVPALGHAWILPFWDKDKRCRMAQLIIGYKGYRDLAHRTGSMQSLVGREVHEHDSFEVTYGLDDRLVHQPFRGGDRGESTDYYTIAKFTGGGHVFWHMTRAEAESHRDRFAMARDKKGKVIGPWRDHFDAMALKTCFLRMARWMPLETTPLALAVAADETVRLDLDPDGIYEGERPGPMAAIDMDMEDDPELTALEAARSAEAAAGGGR